MFIKHIKETMKRRNDYDQTSAIVFVAFVVFSSFAWGTHVVKTILDQNYLFLALGAFMPPVGAIHGVLIWMGIV